MLRAVKPIRRTTNCDFGGDYYQKEADKNGYVLLLPTVYTFIPLLRLYLKNYLLIVQRAGKVHIPVRREIRKRIREYWFRGTKINVFVYLTTRFHRFSREDNTLDPA